MKRLLNRLAVGACALAVSFGAFAAFGAETAWPSGTTKTTAVVLGSDDAPLATGTVTIPDAGALAGTLAIKQTLCATQTVSGGTLAFGTGATISSGLGNLVFDSPVTSDGGLTVRSDTTNLNSLVTIPCNKNTVQVLTGIPLDGLEPISAYGPSGNLQGQTLTAYCIERGSGWLEVQYQIRASGSSYLKGVKVRYEQETDLGPITGTIVYGKYIHADKVDESLKPLTVGTDMDDPLLAAGQPGVNLYTAGYDLSQLKFRWCDESTVTFRHAPELAGTLATVVGTKTTVSFREDDPATFTAPISMSGSLAFETALPSLTFQPSTFSCNADDEYLTLDFRAAEGADADELTQTYAFPDTEETHYSSNWTLVFPKQCLSNLTAIVSARIGGFSITGYKTNSYPANVRFFRNDGILGSFQIDEVIELSGGKTMYKMALMSLRQGYGGIEIRSEQSGWVKVPTAEYPNGYDVVANGWLTDGVDGNITGVSSSTYCMKSGTYRFSRAPRVLEPSYGLGTFNGKSVSLSPSKDTFLWCSVEDDDGLLFAGATQKLEVREGCVLRTPKDKAMSLTKGTYYFHPGSLFIPHQQGIQYGSLHYFDHSTLLLGAQIGGTSCYAIGSDASAYVGKITLDGARVAGAAARFGLGGSAGSVMSVVGSDPSRIDNGIQIYTFPWTASSVTFDVSDVTADAAADLTVGGGLMTCGSQWAAGRFDQSTVYKKGAGTISVAGVNTYTNLIVVQEGTIAYAANGGLGPWAVYTLSGGNLSFASRTTNTVQKLTVDAAAEGYGGTITLGEAADLTVPSAEDLTLNGKLNVIAGLDAVFRVGTPVSGEQMKKLRINGHRVAQLPDGTFGQRRGVALYVK